MASICSLTARNAERLDQLVRVTGLARSELANMVLGWTLAQIEDGDWELIQAILTEIRFIDYNEAVRLIGNFKYVAPDALAKPAREPDGLWRIAFREPHPDEDNLYH